MERRVEFSISDSAARLHARINRYERQGEIDRYRRQTQPPGEVSAYEASAYEPSAYEPADQAPFAVSLPPSPPAVHEWTSALPSSLAENRMQRSVAFKPSATASQARPRSRLLERAGTRASLRAAPIALKRTASTLGTSIRAPTSLKRTVSTLSSSVRSATNTMPVPKARSAASQLAIAALATNLAQKKKEERWRGMWWWSARLATAWFVNLSMAFIFLFYAFIVSLKFGETETRELFGAWGAAYLWTTLIFDPCNVCVVTIMPYLINEDTRCGRCCSRIKFVYDELFAP